MAANKMRFKAVAFDFDGVLVDSVPIKTAAFAELYAPYGKAVVSKVVAFHLAHGGVSRYEKFRHYQEVLLNRPLDEAGIGDIAKRFEGLVLRKVIEAPEVPGSTACLEALRKRGCRLFVVSGTPDEEIKHIVRARGLSGYFSGVFGSPAAKSAHLAEILSRLSLSPAEMLFIGDAATDFEASRAVGTAFLAVRTAENRAYWETTGAQTVPDLRDCCFAIEGIR